MYQTTGLEVTQGGSELVSGWAFYFPDRKQLLCWRLPATPILWALRCLVPASVPVSTAASIAPGERTHGPETTLLIFMVSALDKGDAI